LPDKLRNELPNCFERIRENTDRPHFPVRFGDRDSDAVSVDIKTKKSYFGPATNSFRMQLCAAGFLLRSVTRVTAIRGWSPHID
jgi:hypothetical protein